GQILFNHASTEYDFTADISGNGTISHLAGETVLSGDNSAFTGTATVDGGTLIVQNAFGSAITVNSAGDLVVDGATVEDAVSGSNTGVINVSGGGARITDSTIVNTTTSYGNAVVANGSAMVTIMDSDLRSEGV